jgi:hypothetical protein
MFQGFALGGKAINMTDKTTLERPYDYEADKEAREAALVKLLIAFSFDINEIKALLYSCREKLTKGGRTISRKIHYLGAAGRHHN